MQKAMLKVTTELRRLRRLSAVAVLVKLKLELKAAIAKDCIEAWDDCGVRLMTEPHNVELNGAVKSKSVVSECKV